MFTLEPNTQVEIVDANGERVLLSFAEVKDTQKFFLDEKPCIKMDDKYLQMRFDGIQSIENPTNCSHDIGEIRETVNKKFDYKLKYGAERNHLVNQLLDDVYYIDELKSTTRIIQKEQKKASSPLAENSTLDKTIEAMADYILFTKYDDSQHELTEENKSVENSTYGKHTYNKEYKFLKDFSKDTRQILTENVSYFEEINAFASDEQKLILKKQNKNFKFDDSRFDESYWKKTVKGNHIPHYAEQPENLNQAIYSEFKQGVEEMKAYLGLGGTKEDVERREHEIKALIASESEGKALPQAFDENRQYMALRKMYSEYKGNFEVMKRILSKPVTLSPESGRAVIDINADTWYEDETGKVIELSKNQLRLTDVNLYKAILPLYTDLKDKYEGKYTSDWYWLLWEVDRLIEQTEFTEEERQVIDMVTTMKHTQETVGMSLGLNQNAVSRLLSNTIPKKLLETHLDNVEEWLYTYKLRGTYKTCSTCKEVKLISNDRHFGINKKSPDGHNASCKKCRSKVKNTELETKTV